MMFRYRLLELRKTKKLTQTEMADILGIARTTYSSYEQGRRMPDSEIQNKIADYFKVTLDYLHGRTEKPNQTIIINNDESTPSAKALTVAAHIDDDVTDDQMEDILNYIEFITNKHKKD